MGKSTRGRRPAGSGTRETIIEAARQQFSERGYRRTTLRSIASAAGVDARLVLHYFGSKQRLFIESVELPIDPDVLLARVFEPGSSTLSERAAKAIVAVLEDPASRRVMIGLVRAAASEPEAAQLIREVLTERILVPLARHVGGDHPELRASLMGSQVVGLAMARHVVQIEPLASASREQLIRAVTPVFEHYLTGAWIEDDPTSPLEEG